MHICKITISYRCKPDCKGQINCKFSLALFFLNRLETPAKPYNGPFECMLESKNWPWTKWALQQANKYKMHRSYTDCMKQWSSYALHSMKLYCLLLEINGSSWGSIICRNRTSSWKICKPQTNKSYKTHLLCLWKKSEQVKTVISNINTEKKNVIPVRRLLNHKGRARVSVSSHTLYVCVRSFHSTYMCLCYWHYTNICLVFKRALPFFLFLTGTEINGHAITECGFVNWRLAAKVRVGSTIQMPNKRFNKSSNTADCRLQSHQSQTASSRCFILSRGNIAYWQRTSMFTQTSHGGLLTLHQRAESTIWKL